jgi:PKD repeat protein
MKPKNQTFATALARVFLLVLLAGLSFSHASAYQVPDLAADNLISNPWFSNGYLDGWTDEAADGKDWGLSQKSAVPGPSSVDGFGARLGEGSGYNPGQDAFLHQIVPANATEKTLRFQFWWVISSINQAGIEIYGADSSSGPWSLVWEPWYTTSGGDMQFHQTPLEEITLSRGYSYYKIRVLGNYPVGKVGGFKFTGVYFSTRGGTGGENQPPSARATTSTDSGFAPLGVHFDASSSSDDKAIQSYSWDFGDGTIVEGAIHDHTFTQAGEYDVVLTVRDAEGLIAQESLSISALPQGGGSSGSLLAGTGQAMIAATDPDQTPVLIAETIQEARAAYGAGTPEVVLLINNMGSMEDLIAAIQDEFGAQVPIGGTGTASENYNSFTMDTFVEPPNRSMAILALGGTAIENVFMAQDNTIGQGGNEENVRETGRQIARALLPEIDPAKNNLIHMFGPGHNPNMIIVLEGMKEILGDPTPDYIKIIGAAAANNGFSIANGANDRAVTGVLITGTFDIALRGVGEGFGGDPVVVSKTLMNEVVSELGEVPQVMFYVPGHPDDEGATFAEMRQAAEDVLGFGTSLFGHEGGGEYGHITTDGQPIANKKHFFLAGLSGSGGDPGENQAPQVNAGPDQVISLSQSVSLDGTVSDDGLPDGSLTVLWTKFNGPGEVNFANWMASDTTATFTQSGTYILRLNADDGQLSAVDEIMITVQEGGGTTFGDVPANHPYYDEIDLLYQGGYTSGCSAEPLLYCPDETMDRAESAVFVERGIHGANTLPSQPTIQTFADLPLESWGAKWAEALYADGFTAGCGTSPLIYCPWQGHSRSEGAVFYLRMLHGADYTPSSASGLFNDAPIDSWSTKWLEAAFIAGILPACQESPLQICPEGPLTRGLAAYMMVQAKGLGTSQHVH